jgi:hypothetical protein
MSEREELPTWASYLLILFLGFTAGYTINKSAEERVKEQYRALIGETIESLELKLKSCERRKQVACRLKVVKVVNDA